MQNSFINSDDITGLISVALLFDAKAQDGSSVSLAVLREREAQVLVDLSKGLDASTPGLTRAMKSYLTGLAEISSYLKSRHTEDEDGVTADDIERAAILLAFPRVAQDKAAAELLKAHLNLLQERGILEKLPTSTGEALEPSPALSSAPASATEVVDETQSPASSASSDVGTEAAPKTEGKFDASENETPESLSTDTSEPEHTADDAKAVEDEAKPEPLKLSPEQSLPDRKPAAPGIGLGPFFKR